jgi:hypothetical protein
MRHSDRQRSHANALAAIELVLPGGSLIAILLWLHRRRSEGLMI